MAKARGRDWAAEAEALPGDDFRLAVPVHVTLGEPIDVAAFFEKYWAKKDGRPGLEQAGPTLPRSTGDEIVELQRLAQQAHSRYLMLVDRSDSGEQQARARFVLGEITATLEFLFDDGVEDEKDLQLAQVGQAHRDGPKSIDALASALSDYAALAGDNRKDMKGLGDFDVALIDEAVALARKLLELPPPPSAPSEEARRALAFRNRLLTLLGQRVNKVRSAARFVFRNQPAIIREVTSAYERKRKAAARRAAAKKAAAGGESEP